MIGSDTCAQCGKADAKKRCSACKSVYYCSVECQKVAWPTHKSSCRKTPAAGAGAAAAAAAASQPALPTPPERTGGEWDDVSEQQVHLALSDAEQSKLVAAQRSAPPTLRAALAYGVKHEQVKLFTNAPRYDRLLVWTTKDSSTYVVEAGLDAWEGTGWWTTKDFTEADLKKEGLLAIVAETLEAEYGGVLAFLECCKLLGAPRYTMKTDLDPNAKPHVIAVVERVLANSTLRFLLDAEALERADAKR